MDHVSQVHEEIQYLYLICNKQLSRKSIVNHTEKHSKSIMERKETGCSLIKADVVELVRGHSLIPMIAKLKNKQKTLV